LRGIDGLFKKEATNAPKRLVFVAD
jgi:hypothetical protein